MDKNVITGKLSEYRNILSDVDDNIYSKKYEKNKLESEIKSLEEDRKRLLGAIASIKELLQVEDSKNDYVESDE